ncbi:hypothetical protein TrRE_jg2233 [Triparma retinervis]|uniref:Cyclic nucleotide-binding domain-containing protein n=1 Tax=Triparma retinervis TaxID=2557542 RepID=A0A9W6ZTV6_9STRA|nr:hypothetical protein TrRE_jg2233 [Triparma retinervis]
MDLTGLGASHQAEKYIASMYFCVATLTSVGYGDIHPMNYHEQLFNVFLMLVGCVGYAFCIGATSNFIANFNVRKKQKAKLLKNLENFMSDAGLPLDLREKCRNATTVAANHISLELRAKQSMENLPNSLRLEIMLFMYRKVVRDIKFLRGMATEFPNFVAKCASMMQLPMKVQLGELIVQEGSASEDMYFLVTGTVIAVRQGFPIMELHSGDFFGELGCLLGSQRSSSVYALSNCTLYTLSADALKALNRKYPKVIEELKRIARHRHNKCEQIQKHKKAIANAVAIASRQHAHSIDVIARPSDDEKRKKAMVAETAKEREKFEKFEAPTATPNGEKGEGQGEVGGKMEIIEQRLQALEKNVGRVLEILETIEKRK